MDKRVCLSIATLVLAPLFVTACGPTDDMNLGEDVDNGASATKPPCNKKTCPPPPAQNDMMTGADAPNTFAGAAAPGTYKGTGYLGAGDDDDFYVFAVPYVQELAALVLTPPSGADFKLELIDAQGNVRVGGPLNSFVYVNSASAIARQEAGDVGASGTWRAHVHRNAGQGTYQLAIEATPAILAFSVNTGDTLSGVVDLTGQAGDDQAVAKVELSVWDIDNNLANPNGGQTIPIGVFDVSPPQSPASFSFQLDTTQFPNGWYALTVNANDVPGNGSSWSPQLYFQNP
jgi:hypothetical protein